MVFSHKLFHHICTADDLLANRGTAKHVPLEPDATWTRWADFANKVFHFWRLVGPRFRERPQDEPKGQITG
eukprot:4882288-Amphidinium_carterae.1